jgi:hypothetical protein
VERDFIAQDVFEVPMSFVQVSSRRKEMAISSEWRRQMIYIVTSAAILLPLWVAWQQREYRYITPEQGLGYWLGIIGASLMLLLLLYPLRKRSRAMARFGTVRQWFIVHQLFGMLGPMLIVLHSNFSLGSLNGRIALVSMLTVAFSGLIGRYLYGRSHHGMVGHREALALLRAEEAQQRRELQVFFERVPGLEEELQALEGSLAAHDEGFVGAARAALAVGRRARRVRRKALRALRAAVRRAPAGEELDYREIRREIQAYIRTAVKVAQFDFFERLLSLWHMLHMPLFILLIITAIFHVIAVHMY